MVKSDGTGVSAIDEEVQRDEEEIAKQGKYHTQTCGECTEEYSLNLEKCPYCGRKSSLSLDERQIISKIYDLPLSEGLNLLVGENFQGRLSFEDFQKITIKYASKATLK
ncbi:MAG: hypothetical protein PHU12_01990 [Candidatus Aenigmarchaeota archaeon]|nr:hypothetical protein [Candidatus Aenigmarchaeota archaeon]